MGFDVIALGISSRALEHKKGKDMLPLFLLLKMKFAALLPFILGGIALIAGKALLIGKIALVLSLIIALKKLLSHQKAVTYEIVSHPHHSASHEVRRREFRQGCTMTLTAAVRPEVTAMEVATEVAGAEAPTPRTWPTAATSQWPPNRSRTVAALEAGNEKDQLQTKVAILLP
ncbi:hypothetical protein M8J75_006706 [Diaphorina citri]|nr:hypothetical protein M8J75_006706 [Diaphorina citri]